MRSDVKYQMYNIVYESMISPRSDIRKFLIIIVSFDLLIKLYFNSDTHQFCLAPLSKRMLHMFTCNKNVDIKFSVRDAHPSSITLNNESRHFSIHV